MHAYFAESLEMVEWGKFDTLAHITYPLRYMCKAGETPSYKPYQDELDAVLKALIKSDIALEFNTSRILRTDAPKLPDREVYSRYKELGGKLVTIGADAHRTENIASGVEEAMELLSDIGYKEYTVFVERNRCRCQSNKTDYTACCKRYSRPYKIKTEGIKHHG